MVKIQPRDLYSPLMLKTSWALSYSITAMARFDGSASVAKKRTFLKTDNAAMSCIDPEARQQDKNNYIWIRDADKHDLVVGNTGKDIISGCHGQDEYRAYIQ